MTQWLACQKRRNLKKTQKWLVCWVDRLLPSDYQIKHIPGKNMGLVDYLPRHPVGDAPLVSEMDNTFVLAQMSSVNRLLQPS